MVSTRRPPRSAGLCFLLAFVLAMAAIASLPGDGATAVSGPTGPVNVTVTPTADLTDGQAISIHASMTSGNLIEMRAHICVPNAGIELSFDFGFLGPYCSNVAPGSGNFQTFQVFPPGATQGDLTFNAGIGTVVWTDNDPATHAEHTLICDSTHSCDLVVQFQNNLGNPVYFTAPLTFAGEGTTAPDSTSSTTTSSTTTSSTTTSSTTTSSTTTSSTTSSSTTSSTTTTTQPASTTTTGSSTTTTTGAGATTTSLPGTPGGSTSPSNVPPGGTFTVSSSGWQPNSPVEATLHSTPVSLGTITADATGLVQGTFSAPSTVETGAHTVQLVGTASTGGARTVNFNLTIATTSSGSASAGSTSTGSTTVGGTLAFTGASTRDLLSAAFLALAAGLFLLSLSFRRRPALVP